MTKADQIDTYIKTQLAKIRVGTTITTFLGDTYTFKTDAGQLVDKHLEYTEHPDAMPGIVFYTGKNDSDLNGDVPPELGMENHLQECSIEGFIADDKAGTQGDALKIDISVAIKADPWFGGLVEQFSGFSTDSAIQVGEEVFSIVRVGFSVLYTTPFGSE